MRSSGVEGVLSKMTLFLGIWTRLHETLPLLNRIFALSAPGSHRGKALAMVAFKKCRKRKQRTTLPKCQPRPAIPRRQKTRLFKSTWTFGFLHLPEKSRAGAHKVCVCLWRSGGELKTEKCKKTSPSFFRFALYSSCLMCSLDPTGGPVILFKFDDMAAFASFAVFAKYSCSH